MSKNMKKSKVSSKSKENPPPPSSSSSSSSSPQLTLSSPPPQLPKDNDDEYMTLLTTINNQIEKTLIEKDTFDKIKLFYNSEVKGIEKDINDKLDLLDELSQKEKDVNDALSENIVKMNVRLNEFKEQNQNLDLLYVQSEEEIVKLFKVSSALEENIEDDVKLLEQESHELKVLEDRYDSEIVQNADTILMKSNEIFMSNVNLLESIMDGIETNKKSYENSKPDIRLAQAAMLYSSI